LQNSRRSLALMDKIVLIIILTVECWARCHVSFFECCLQLAGELGQN
jgi:hypothetical protein